MFWRFGYNAASGIDTLLDKDDVSLEAILDEDELLQECKSQNTRLIDYFQRPDVLQRLLGYVTGEIDGDGEERGRFKYPYVATEVLCSEIWSIVETCMNEQTQLLLPFWESLLDRSPEEMKTQMVMASHFAKINAVFLGKKPAEMLAFIQSLPNVVERILKHIENPSFVDLLVRIIQLDEYPGGTGVLEWLSGEHLMKQLVDRLSPTHHPELHIVIAELIKGIISLATPSPGSSVSDSVQNGTSSNLFARELARRESITQLFGYSLHQFGEDDLDFDACTSSVIQSMGVIIELIRKNNSDYFEPYLFHTLRNRLMQVQQQLSSQPENVTREALEQTMTEMVERMGVVHLGPVLEIVNENLGTLVQFLKTPRSATGPVASTVGVVFPLTFERFRICELIAELLHCSNMSLLNRSDAQNMIYDAEGRLTGGLAGLEELAKLVDLPDHDEMEDVDEMQLPVSVGRSPSLLDSDEDMSDEDAMEAMEVYEDVPISSSPQSVVVPSSPNAASLPPPAEIAARASSDSSKETATFVGEKMKARLLELEVLPVLLNLFFDYPWNNFLHSAVYDIVHQILTGNLEESGGWNRALAVSLLKDAGLRERIVEGQRVNDVENAKPKGVRLGYMGHLQMISEDVLIALESFPSDVIAPSASWEEYVTTRYLETKKRDNMLLGGGKPVIGSGVGVGVGRWRVDENEDDAGIKGVGSGGSEGDSLKGEFRRTGVRREGSSSGADFGPAPMEEDSDEEEEAPHFARYLAQEMNGSGSDDEDDDPDEGWLSRSSFTLGNPPVTARGMSLERRPLSASGFDDAFDPNAQDPFGDDDAFGPFSDDTSFDFGEFQSAEDGFGGASSGLSGSIGSDGFDATESFQPAGSASFGFQSDFNPANDRRTNGEGESDDESGGALTPTAGSWTFASDDFEESPKTRTRDIDREREGTPAPES